MRTLGKPERLTQKRAIALLRDELTGNGELAGLEQRREKTRALKKAVT